MKPTIIAMQTIVLLVLTGGGCNPSASNEQTSARRHKTAEADDSVPRNRAPAPEKDAAPKATPVQDQRFEITRKVESYDTFVDMRPKGAQHPSLDWRLKSNRLFITWHREHPLSRQVDLLRDMVTLLAASEDSVDLSQASLSTGLDWYSNPEYAKRIAMAADTDDDWNAARRIKKQQGDPAWSLHRYIVRVSESKRLFTELDEIFAPLRVRPILESVEKCSTGRADGKGELGKLFRESGIKSQKVLPAGCLMSWFKLEKLSGL